MTSVSSYLRGLTFLSFLSLVSCTLAVEDEPLPEVQVEGAAEPTAAEVGTEYRQRVSNANADSVTVDRVRRCRNRFPLPCNGVDGAEYPEWSRHGVAKAKRKRTYIARYADAPRQQTRYAIFLAAGQQDFGLNLDPTQGGNSDQITGQPKRFRKRFKVKDGRVGGFVLNNSLARFLIEDARSPFPPNVTFMAGAWDARFHHNFSKDNKNEILRAYRDWLLAHFDPERVELVYLAGFSRGGCLVARLAQLLNQQYPSLPMVVHVFDGVCKAQQSEFGVRVQDIMAHPSLSPIDNIWARSTNVAAQFRETRSVQFFNLVGGYPVAGGAGIRAFSHREAEEEFFDNGWYRQQWFTRKHEDMTDFHERAIRNPTIEHLREGFEHFRCPAHQRWTPSGRCVDRCQAGTAWDGNQCQLACFDWEQPVGSRQCCSYDELLWIERPDERPLVCEYINYGTWTGSTCKNCRSQ